MDLTEELTLQQTSFSAKVMEHLDEQLNEIKKKKHLFRVLHIVELLNQAKTEDIFSHFGCTHIELRAKYNSTMNGMYLSIDFRDIKGNSIAEFDFYNSPTRQKDKWVKKIKVLQENLESVLYEDPLENKESLTQVSADFDDKRTAKIEISQTLEQDFLDVLVNDEMRTAYHYAKLQKALPEKQTTRKKKI